MWNGVSVIIAIMPIRAFLIAVPILAASVAASPASVRITHDQGGRIGTYIAKFRQIRSTDQQVVIDGDCLSACTLVSALIPRERICVTHRARLGFHRAWKPGFLGQRVDNDAGTRIMWRMYPPNIRRWIASKGGLSDRVLYLSGAELSAYYPRCR